MFITLLEIMPKNYFAKAIMSFLFALQFFELCMRELCENESEFCCFTGTSVYFSYPILINLMLFYFNKSF